jgi:hypothetical protein
VKCWKKEKTNGDGPGTDAVFAQAALEASELVSGGSIRAWGPSNCEMISRALVVFPYVGLSFSACLYATIACAVSLAARNASARLSNALGDLEWYSVFSRNMCIASRGFDTARRYILVRGHVVRPAYVRNGFS